MITKDDRSFSKRGSRRDLVAGRGASATGAYSEFRLDTQWGCSSAGERLLCKQEVTGSNPVSSTMRAEVCGCATLVGRRMTRCWQFSSASEFATAQSVGDFIQYI